MTPVLPTPSGAPMRHPSARPADGADALFGLDALDTGGAPPEGCGSAGHDGSAGRGPADRSLFRDSPAARRLLPVRTVYAEPASAASARGREILARFPDAEVIEVASHWGHPGVARQRGQCRALGAREGGDAGPGRAQDADHTAQRTVRRLDRPRSLERVRDGVRVLLRPAPQGLRQPRHRLHQHRRHPRPPGPAHRPPGPQAGTQPVRRVGLGLRHRGRTATVRWTR